MTGPGTPASRSALAFAVGVFAALALFGGRYHWVEEAGTAERDGYVARAEEILAGALPRDPYRPLLYPLTVAGLSHLGLSPFAAARLVSNAAAAVLVWLAFAFGRRLGGEGGGLFAMALTAVNPNLWILGQHVTTDALFAALAGLALLASLDYAGVGQDGSRPMARAVVAGTFLGLAAFTRANALFLLPAMLLAWWWRSAQRPPRRSVTHLGAAGTATVLCLLPHWILRQAVFGNPFHDENWRNLAWKLYGFPDWSYLESMPFHGLWEVVRHDPTAVVTGAVAELGRFASQGVDQLLGTWVHVGLLVMGVAVVLTVPRRRGAATLLLVAASFFLTATAFAFFAWGRLLLVLLPVLNAFAAATVPWARSRASRLAGGAGRLAAAALPAGAVLAVALLALKTFAFRLPAFIRHHPYREVAVLRQLEQETPRATILAGTSPFLGRYLEERDCREEPLARSLPPRSGRRDPESPSRVRQAPGDCYVYVPDAFGREVEEPERYFETLREILLGARVSYLVVGRLDVRSRPASLLTSRPPVGWLQLDRRLDEPGGEGDVWVFAVLASR